MAHWPRALEHESCHIFCGTQSLNFVEIAQGFDVELQTGQSEWSWAARNGQYYSFQRSVPVLLSPSAVGGHRSGIGIGP